MGIITITIPLSSCGSGVCVLTLQSVSCLLSVVMTWGSIKYQTVHFSHLTLYIILLVIY